MGLQLLGTGIDKYTLVNLLGMKAAFLLDEDQGSSHARDDDQDDESCNKPDEEICDNKADNGSSNGSCGPVDVASLQPHELKGFLQPLEYWVLGKHVLLILFCHSSQRYLNDGFPGAMRGSEPSETPEPPVLFLSSG